MFADRASGATLLIVYEYISEIKASTSLHFILHTTSYPYFTLHTVFITAKCAYEHEMQISTYVAKGGTCLRKLPFTTVLQFLNISNFFNGPKAPTRHKNAWKSPQFNRSQNLRDVVNHSSLKGLHKSSS